jgi:CheY-like chemotaxis protein
MPEPRPYILLIDDDSDDLEMFSSELEKKGLRVKTFDSSTNALFYLKLMFDIQQLPSLIIMDYNMPKRNGYQVLQLIKDNKDTKNIPVVMYSTSMSAILKTQLGDAGALHCFNKPWTTKELYNQVQIFHELASSITNKNFV